MATMRNIVGLSLVILVILNESDAFIKAAIGLRLGYSPAEKGYGKPLEISDLHSKTPILKGHFLTGVHAAPSSHEQHGKGHGHGHGQHGQQNQGNHGNGHEAGFTAGAGEINDGVYHGQNNGFVDYGNFEAQNHGQNDHGQNIGQNHGQNVGHVQIHHGQNGQIEHGQNSNDVQHGQNYGTGGKNGLLRHLKILGVNLYLGGPKDSAYAPKPRPQGYGQVNLVGQNGQNHGQNHGQNNGHQNHHFGQQQPKAVSQLFANSGARSPEQLAHLQMGRGPRGQYSPNQGQQQQIQYGHGEGPLVIEGGKGHFQNNQNSYANNGIPHVVGELRGIDAQNEVGGGVKVGFGEDGQGSQPGSGYSYAGGATGEVFQPAASQYNGYPPHLNGVHQQMFREFINPASVPQQTQSAIDGSAKPDQQQQQQAPQSGDQNRPAGPHPHPPRKQGFSLASLMKGPQWASNLLRLSPLKIHFGKTPPPHFPHPQNNKNQAPNPNQQNHHVQGPQNNHHHQQGQGPNPITSQSSPNPTTSQLLPGRSPGSLQFSTLYSTNPSPNPPPPHPPVFTVMPASASDQPQFSRSLSGTIIMTPMQTQNLQNVANSIHGSSTNSHPFSAGPGFTNGDYFSSLPSPQQLQNNLQKGPGQFFAQEPQMERYPHPNHQDFANQPQMNSQNAQTLPEFNRYESSEGPPSFNNNNGGDYNSQSNSQQGFEMPENMRLPGFAYSHSETSPIMSMGMQSYDDPPVMMDHGPESQAHGHPQQQQGRDQGPGQGFNQGGGASGPREISESEYNSFLSAPTNTHSQRTSQIQAPSTGRMNFEHPFAPRQLQQQQQQNKPIMHHRTNHLASSLRNWNPFLNKKENISRSFETSAASSSSEVAVLLKEQQPLSINGVPKKWIPIIRRSTTKTSAEVETKAGDDSKN